jgi:hypothetical protein
MTERDDETIERIARAIREEIIRQYRDDDRGKCPAGVLFWEEEIQPILLAEVAMRAHDEHVMGKKKPRTPKRPGRKSQDRSPAHHQFPRSDATGFPRFNAEACVPAGITSSRGSARRLRSRWS